MNNIVMVEEEKKEGEPSKPVTAEEFAKALAERDIKIEELVKSKDETQEGFQAKIESLQDSLDSALEEIALRGGGAEAEEEEEKEGEEKEEEKEEEAEGKPKAEGEEEGKVDVESEIERAIKDDADFREGILMREEMRDLKDELSTVLGKYPEANEEEILLAIEDGEEEANSNQVEVLAKASHERHSTDKSEMSKKIEEDLRAKLQKEGEGGISIPQSPGTPAAPQAPQPGATPAQSEDKEWNEALQKAKVEGGGT